MDCIRCQTLPETLLPLTRRIRKSRGKWTRLIWRRGRKPTTPCLGGEPELSSSGRSRIHLMAEYCAICGCGPHRTPDTYARATTEGRGHATQHHFVAERFFGRSSNRPGTQTEGIFASCPWGYEGESALFCYECHEELLHNPVLLPEDFKRFARVVQVRGLSEESKTEDRAKIAGRIALFHEVIARGLSILCEEAERAKSNRVKGSH